MLKVFFLGVAVLGAACAAFGVYFILYGQQARSWPSVEGRIVSTAIRIYTPRATSGTSTQEQRERRRRYFPEVTYQWSVDGQSYEGSRYAIGEGHPDFAEREEAVAAARSFPAGRPIDVFYDPEEPSAAVIDRSLKGGVFVPLPLGLVMMAVGVFGLRKLPQLQAALKTSAPDNSFDIG